VAKQIKKRKTDPTLEQRITELSDFERAKTLLVLLESSKKNDPNKKSFRWKPEALLTPLRDEFEMNRAFEILDRETKGNIRAKYETADVFSEASGKLLGMQSKTVFLRIKNDAQFFKDCKRIFAKQEKEAGNFIEKIEIIEDEFSNTLRVFVNENYENDKIKPNKIKISWSALLRIAKQKRILCESEHEVEYLLDFFNTNRANVLYKWSHLALTEVLSRDGYAVLPRIPIRVITEKTITQRTSKPAA